MVLSVKALELHSRFLFLFEKYYKILLLAILRINMGVSNQYPLLEIVPLVLKGAKDQNKALEGCEDKGLMKRRVVSGRTSTNIHVGSSKRPKRVLMKRRRLGASRRRNGNGIVRRVRTLKRLVPKSGNSEGLDGLFRETADYILSLQMRVRVMQIMVKVLSGSDEE